MNDMVVSSLDYLFALYISDLEPENWQSTIAKENRKKKCPKKSLFSSAKELGKGKPNKTDTFKQ